MATLRDIKRRINAVSNTKQITKAMKMVAAAKLRKAQARMIQMRPYAEKMNSVIAALSGGEGDLHPLLVQRPRRTIELLVLTSDRGLCGAFNSNVLKEAERTISGWKAENFRVSISVVGRKARDYFKRRKVEMRNEWTGLSGKLVYSDVRRIAEDIIENYMNEAIDEVFIVYNQFKTVISQEVVVAQLVPMAPPESEKGGEGPEEASTVFIYEPSQQAILSQLLPKNIEVQIYRALLESQASEEAARMTAMENATKNADEMIDSLTLQYNKARQASITAELMDIVGGVEALKG
ncbi:MAG: ATP synthase F1 subunit gamma [Deferribacteres bacterium]|nr:ATP synthase F1 subunit gamma [Deferribacteres bacterium]